MYSSLPGNIYCSEGCEVCEGLVQSSVGCNAELGLGELSNYDDTATL